MADYLIRPAEARDLDAVAGIYNRIHDAEEQGRQQEEGFQPQDLADDPADHAIIHSGLPQAKMSLS